MNQTPTLPSPFRIIPLARLGAGGRWRTEAMRSYGAPVLYWFTRGQGRITIAGQTAGYGAHNAVFLPAGTMHGFEMPAQVHGLIVVFPAGCETQLDLPVNPMHLRLRESDQHLDLNKLIENLQNEMQDGDADADTALMCHAGLLAIWLRRQIIAGEQVEETLPRKNAAMRLAAAFTSLVETDFHSAKSVRDYAADLGVTPTHLSRVCNKACGRPASAILADRVHYEARRMLTETHMPIKDIAVALGFASPAYFTRAFHNHTGRTPSEFRRSV